MTENRPPILPALSLGGAVLLASLATLPTGVPVVIRTLLPALAAIPAYLLLARSTSRTQRSLTERASAAEAAVAAATKAASQLRHDLRGILSPALLTADRLSNSQDPIARRAAEAMISTVERAEQRLKDA